MKKLSIMPVSSLNVQATSLHEELLFHNIITCAEVKGHPTDFLNGGVVKFRRSARVRQ